MTLPPTLDETALTLAVLQAAARPHRPETQVIDDLERLRAWRHQLRALTRSRNLPTVAFRLPALSPGQNQILSARAESYRSDCGCGVGGFVMTMSVVACLAWYALTGADVMRLAAAAPLLVSIALGASGGKIAGLALARWRLIGLAARTEARLRDDVLVSLKG